MLTTVWEFYTFQSHNHNHHHHQHHYPITDVLIIITTIIMDTIIITYRWLTEQVSVVVNGQQSQLLQIVSHEGGCAVEERLQLVLLLVAGNLFALVALVKDGLHFWEPPAHIRNTALLLLFERTAGFIPMWKQCCYSCGDSMTHCDTGTWSYYCDNYMNTVLMLWHGDTL